MTVAAHTGELAPWLAFAGKALLSPNADELRALLEELREQPRDDDWEQVLDALDEALRGDPLEIRKEHVRLFLSPAGAPCPPWQSAHGEEPQLMGASHTSALRWYRSRNAEPRDESEPADHIGLLLLFYAHLLANEEPEEQLETFRGQHLAWTSEFCHELAQKTSHKLFLNVARLVPRLIQDVTFRR